MSSSTDTWLLACPVPSAGDDHILLAHGEGGLLTRKLIRQVLAPALDNPLLRPLADGATLPQPTGRLVMTTDSFVVSPLVFPGGDIGSLAVHGTVNDLAVCGARPLYLSVGLILEEGLPLETLRRVVGSMAQAAKACGVSIVTGDTKVVPRGAADQLFINTTGIGVLGEGIDWGTYRIQAGDRILVSGTIGDHGLAVLAAREQLELEGDLTSDSASLASLIEPLHGLGNDLRFLRDPTRGGVAAVLHEIADAAKIGVVIEEQALPLSLTVRGASALLGLDPLFVANEGKAIIIVAPDAVDKVLSLLHSHPLGRNAAVIGIITAEVGQVLVRGPLGALRVLDEPTGAPLPRIC